MPLLLLWNRIDFSSDENEAPPSRVVAMNCSMVYCFTARASGVFVFATGVCFVINALFETSGFRSVAGFWAEAIVNRNVKVARIPARTSHRELLKFVRCMMLMGLVDFPGKQKTYDRIPSTFIAALWPGMPLTAPPRWALDPQRKTFSNSVSTPHVPACSSRSANGNV